MRQPTKIDSIFLNECMTNNKIKDPIFHNEKNIIKNQVKENKSIIYGGQAIRKHIGFLARPTKDFDILSKTPNKSARQLERKLDILSGGDNYFIKQAIHKGTFKVQHKGLDRRKNTEDDVEVADFTKPERKVKVKVIGGIRYVHLSETIRDKKKALRDETYAFRHTKDKDDLQRIRLHQTIKRFDRKFKG